MVDVRRASPDDAPELTRLRGVMLGEMASRPPAANNWQELAEQTLREQLGQPSGVTRWAGFVVDRPGRRGLAACAVGIIEHRLGEPSNPSGEVGHVFNVCTDPGYRRRGYSRACVSAVLAWFRDRGIRRVDLKATPAGAPLYRALGFVDSTTTGLKLTLGGTDHE